MMLLLLRFLTKQKKSIPKLGLINLQDSETKQEMLIDSSSIQQLFERKQQHRLKNLESQFRNSGIDLIVSRSEYRCFGRINEIFFAIANEEVKSAIFVCIFLLMLACQTPETE